MKIIENRVWNLQVSASINAYLTNYDTHQSSTIIQSSLSWQPRHFLGPLRGEPPSRAPDHGNGQSVNPSIFSYGKWMANGWQILIPTPLSNIDLGMLHHKWIYMKHMMFLLRGWSTRGRRKDELCWSLRIYDCFVQTIDQRGLSFFKTYPTNN